MGAELRVSLPVIRTIRPRTDLMTASNILSAIASAIFKFNDSHSILVWMQNKKGFDWRILKGNSDQS